MKYLTILLTLLLYSCNSAQVDCSKSNVDPDGYLLKTCEYLVKNQIDVSPTKANEYKIKELLSSTENGVELIEVKLNCCFLGDSVVINPSTGKIIKFNIGDK